MKALLLLFLLPAALWSQSVGITAGGGIGTINNAWKRAAPTWSAGLVVDNPIGQKSGAMLGLHYRQRADKDTRLHTVQADFAGQYIGERIRAGAGGFFALAAGTKSDLEPDQKLGSGVGLSAFFAYRAWKRLSFRIVYDHGLTDLSEGPGKITAQGISALIEFGL